MKVEADMATKILREFTIDNSINPLDKLIPGWAIKGKLFNFILLYIFMSVYLSLFFSLFLSKLLIFFLFFCIF